jgi:hypothetical protein
VAVLARWVILNLEPDPALINIPLDPEAALVAWLGEFLVGMPRAAGGG